MKSRVTRSFRKRFTSLPKQVQDQARRAYALWRESPYHNSLEFKRVSERQPIRSVRIGLGWRALGLVEEETIYWFWIGSHAEYDVLLKRLELTRFCGLSLTLENKRSLHAKNKITVPRRIQASHC